MTFSYICLRCQRATATRSARSYQFRRTSFVSLGQLVDGGRKESLLPAQKKGAEEIRGSPRTTYPPKRNRRDSDPQLEGLFSSTTRPNSIVFDKTSEGARKHEKPVYMVPARTLVDEHIQTLEHMLYKQRAPLTELWKASQGLLDSEVWQRMVSDAGSKEDVVFSEPQLNIFRDILLQVAHVRSRYPRRAGFPLVANAIRAYRRHSMMKDWWDQVLWKQLRGYILLNPFYSGQADVRDYSITVLEELIEVWRLLIQEYGEPANSSSDNAGKKDTGALSSTASVEAYSESSYSANEQTPTNISQRFSDFWPLESGNNPQMSRMATAAITTFDILKRQHNGPLRGSVERHGRSLLRSFKPLVERGQVEWDSAIQCLGAEGFDRLVARRIIRRWTSIPVTVIRANLEKDSEEHYGAIPSAHSTREVTSSTKELNHALRSAIAKADANSVLKMWRQAEKQIASENFVGAHRDELFSLFLSAFFALKRHSNAVDVWNCMVNVNHQPTQKHWHAMLAGSAAAKDLSSLRELWNNMLSAGIEPDMTTWATWIHGLMVCGDSQAGLRALEDLGKTWKSTPTETTTSFEKSLKPSLTPIRAALSGLAHSNNIVLASTVLSWAHSQNLHPDTQIYNIILRPAVRANDQSRVESILRTMQSSSCPPDIATFTIILNGVLSNPSSTFHTQALPEQNCTIFAILSEMERNGLKPNTYTYSTILDGLLDPKIFNIEAAQAIMQHMTANHIRPSPHVYTILTTHYFALEPPDLPAIESLLHRIKIEKTPLDTIFWDRMIEAYARVGETEKMLMVLRRMPEQGQSPGWMALLACLRCLVDAREWEAVRELVRDVEDVRGVLRYGSGPWRGKDAFWELVGSVRGEGLLGEKE